MNRIYVIDDSEVNLFLVRGIFDNDKNLQVDIESNSTKAMGYLKENKPNVIVLDLMMPEIDGFELLHEIKSNDELKNIPILVISAREDKEAYDKVMEYNVQGYIRKPIVIDDVEKQIRNLI